MDTHELAWCAGFFDGEGSTHPGKKGEYKVIRLSVAQAELAPLERFRRAVGLGSIEGPYAPRGVSTLPKWIYRVYSYEEVQYVVCLLWPWLGDTKRAQAARCLIGYRSVDRNVKGSAHHNSKLDEESVKELWDLRSSMSQTELCRLYASKCDVNESTIKAVLRGVSWNHVTGLPRYKPMKERII
jgi:hypothetical protein